MLVHVARARCEKYNDEHVNKVVVLLNMFIRFIEYIKVILIHVLYIKGKAILFM